MGNERDQASQYDGGVALAACSNRHILGGGGGNGGVGGS